MSAGRACGCFTVAAELGLHARPAGEFAALARSFNAEIQVSRSGEWVDAREVLELLSLAAIRGVRLRLRARGPEAVRAVAALGALLARPHSPQP